MKLIENQASGNARVALYWLFNPFHYIAGIQSLCLGIIAIFLTGVISWKLGVRFDGIFNVHEHLNASVWIYIADGFVNWFSVSILLLVAGRILSKTFRAIDLLGTLSLARWPGILTGIILLIIKSSASNSIGSRGDVMHYVIPTIAIVINVWIAVLMYNAYSISCNVKGIKAVVSFLVGLVTAVVLSTLISHYVPAVF